MADITTLENIDLKDDQENESQIRRSSEKWKFLRGRKFPTASYEITKVTENTAGDYNTLLEGNLTIKGHQKPVQFKAKCNGSRRKCKRTK